LADAQATPLLAALGDRQARVQDRDRLAEALDEAPDDLRRECDLRNEHDRTTSTLQGLGCDPQVDLCLARPRDAREQPRLRSPTRKCLAELAKGVALLCSQRRWLAGAGPHVNMGGAHGREPAFASAEPARGRRRQ